MAGRSGQAVSPGAAAHCNRQSTGPKASGYAGLSEGAGTVGLHGRPAREEHHDLCPWLEKTARMSSLGKGYTQEDAAAVLSGKKEHTPRKKPVAAVPAAPKINLLVDIQAKLQEGKGMGYVNWAKTFNLKQMAQTMMYLSEHNLMDYAVLKEKASYATARYDALAARIKAAENRMSEIAELRTQIINYAKTREVYEAYRKAGYSKKFLAEHEGDILLHKAAKAAFDKRKLKKLPKVKELSAEYQELLAEKRKLYPEYRRAREEMRELLTVKANVDQLLNRWEKKERILDDSREK